MRNLVSSTAFLLCLLFMACSPATNIQSEPAPGFALSTYRQFAFMEVSSEVEDAGPNYQGHIHFLKQEIAQQLEQRGLRQVEAADEADLLINLGIVVDKQVQTRETNIITDPPRYIGQRRYTWQSKEVEVGRYNVGTVSVHLVDPVQNELVWQGTAERIISDRPEKLREQIEKGIAQLVEEIPS
ncbi:DUF4136 domain-containing protein [Pontibacter ramchanderi]|uniref:Uncharacterized protein DUF4136 n=1 Tax=Pontibacter ramchanderi TaxID=1179743 RepID=A0A2N3V3T3_9BACT|nr:DUF4136 domain-containing protein [Pontibacter ramchanderi]PKV76305.1 uncharacterized protein DUF4136 [Pontibacter ramchanderi]